MTLLYLKPKVARGNHRAAEGFLGQIARYAKIESRGNPLFLKPLGNIQEETAYGAKVGDITSTGRIASGFLEGSQGVHRFPKKTERQAARDWPQWGVAGKKTNFCDQEMGWEDSKGGIFRKRTRRNLV
jgi:hypothetical protein